LKILYVTTISNTVNAFLIPHIRYLIEEGNQVDVACNCVQELSPELEKLGCSIHDVGFQRSPLSRKNYVAYKKLKMLAEREKYDLIHTHTPIASFIARLVYRNNNNIRVLYTAHGFHFHKGAPKKNWVIFYPMEKLAARWTNGIITINEEDYNLASRLRLKDNNFSIFKVNGVGIDLRRFLPQKELEKSQLKKKYGYEAHDLILLSVAELNHNKHQDLLINAVSLLKNKMPNIKLLLAGAGDLEERYKKQTEVLGVQDNITFLGYRRDIPELLKIADVVVSSSRREGLPVNIMEAMATGLPLVVTDCRGNRDLVKNNANGYVVGINDVEGFANAVDKLCMSKELRQEFGNKSLQMINHYSVENVIEEMKKIYSTSKELD
jgi:glycosyltransferase EpsD